MLSYVKFLKDILVRKKRLGEFKTVALTQECSHMLQNKISHKLKDLVSFTISCSIGTKYNDKTLVIWGLASILCLYQCSSNWELEKLGQQQ